MKVLSFIALPVKSVPARSMEVGLGARSEDRAIHRQAEPQEDQEMKSLTALIAAAGMAVTVVSAASAQDMTPAEEYYNYRAAVVAYERCNGVTLNQEQATAVEGRITEMLSGFVSPSQRLTIIEDAKTDYSRLAGANSCSRNEQLSAAVETFEMDLAPAIGM